MRTIPENPRTEGSDLRETRPRDGKYLIGAGTRGNKKPRAAFICPNCGKRFTINQTDAKKRLAKTKLPGLFCRHSCLIDYIKRTGCRNTHGRYSASGISNERDP